MKLLFIAESFPESQNVELTGGVETGDFYICRELAKRHQVIVMTMARKKARARDQFDGVEILRLGRPVVRNKRESLLNRLSFMIAAIKEARNTEFDVIHGSNFYSHLITLIVAKLKDKPAVVKTADVYLGDWFKNTSWLTAVVGEISERIIWSVSWQGIIAWSQSTKNKLIAIGVRQPITVIGGGVETEVYAKIKVKKYPSPALVCVSRLVSYKQVDLIIKAFAVARETIPDLQLMIIGQGPESARLKKLANSLGVSKAIAFKGFIKEHRQVIKVVKKSHLFVHASRVEGFGLATLEALACGVPYVHLDLSVTREITFQGKGGLLFDGDYRSMAQAILSLLKDKKLYTAKVAEAQQVINHHQWGKVAQETEKIFKQAIN